MKRSELRQLIKEEMKNSYSLKENKNPELEKKVINFLSSLAKYYGYSMFDAYQAVEQVLERKADEFGEGKYDVKTNKP